MKGTHATRTMITTGTIPQMMASIHTYPVSRSHLQKQVLGLRGSYRDRHKDELLMYR